MRPIARTMCRPGIAPDPIYTSPLVRARQTAAILARQLEGDHDPQVVDELCPGGRMDRMLRDIQARHRHPAAVVMLASHEPDLGRLPGVLLCGNAGAALRFRQGGFCRLEVRSGRPRYGRGATLQCCVAPRLLHRNESRAG